MGTADQAMRIWLNPDRMASLGITTTDVATAVRTENQRFAAGNVGASPSEPETVQTFPIIAPFSPSTDVSGYENIVVRSESEGSAIVRVKDVADVSLGMKSYQVNTNMNGLPTTFIAIYSQPGAKCFGCGRRCVQSTRKSEESVPRRYRLQRSL